VTAIAPYQSAVQRSRAPGFGALLRAEWTKLRTVRGWVIGLLLAVLLPVGITLLGHSECGSDINGVQSIGCPGAPIGPDGSAVTDTFYFVHQALPPDGSITARVTALTGRYSHGGPTQAGPGGAPADLQPGTQPWSKAGIMIKAGTTPGSAYAAMLVTGSNGTRMQWNYTGDAAGLAGPVSSASPRWLRLVRHGSVVTGYDSADGATWTQVGRVDVHGLPATGPAQVGLFATSPSHNVVTTSFGGSSATGGPSLATGTFDHAAVRGSGSGSWTGTSIAPPPPPLPPQFGTAPPGFEGSFRQAGAAAFTVTGSGDIAPNVVSAPDGIGMSPQSALTGVFAALIVVIIVAALFIAAEYRRGMIRVTLAATPARWRVLAAKSVVIGLVTFVVGLVVVGVTLPLGLRQLRSGGNWIPPIQVMTEARMIVGTALLLAVAAVLALGIGTLARRSVLAIAGVIVVIFVPFMLAHVPGLLPAGAQEWLLRLTPTAAFSVQQVYPAYHQVLAPYIPADGYYPLSPWAGFAVLCAWAAVALATAGWLLRRRDA
jgi:ABC-type transport system involved in multi-copper enzyme maturation permease subunit